MKKLMAALIMLGLSNQAFAAAHLRIDCSSDSDPDYANISIYQDDNGKIFGFIQEYYGDGDGYAEDVVEMAFTAASEADTFVQIPGKYPKSKLAPKATKKTQGAVLRVVPDKDKTLINSLVGITSPSGNDLVSDYLNCKRVSKFERKR